MKKVLQRFLCVVLAAISAFCLFACKGDGKDTPPPGADDNPPAEEQDYVTAKNWGKTRVDSIKFDCLDDDAMPLFGYLGPTRGVTTSGGRQIPSLVTDEMFSKIAESGVNMIIGTADDVSTSATRDVMMDALDLAAKYGLSYFFADSSVVNVDTGFVTQKNMTEAMSDYIDHKAFAGLYFRDEPKTNHMNSIATAQEEFYTGIGNKNLHPYVNLYPYIHFGGLAKYEEYLDAFMETQPKYIMYDHYPFFKNKEGEVGNAYFTNLSVIRKYADKYRIPFWSFMQLCGKNGDAADLRTPNASEIMYQVNTTLAYGAKGIAWFPMFQPHYWSEITETMGLFSYDGTKTSLFDVVKRADTFISSIDHVLMNAQNLGIIYEGSTPCPTSNFAEEKIASKKFRELAKIEGASVMVGCFDCKGKTALYVVNNSITKGSTVKLTFDDNYKYDLYLESGKYTVKGTTLDLEFGAGEAALVTLY